MQTIIAILLITAALSTFVGLILVKLIKIIEPYIFLAFGIEITLLGIFFGTSPNYNLHGYDLCIILTGLIISVFGLKKTNK